MFVFLIINFIINGGGKLKTLKYKFYLLAKLVYGTDLKYILYTYKLCNI